MHVLVCKQPAAGGGSRGGGSAGNGRRSSYTAYGRRSLDVDDAEAGYHALGMGIGTPPPPSQPSGAPDPRTQAAKTKIKPIISLWWSQRYEKYPAGLDEMIDYCVRIGLDSSIFETKGTVLEGMQVPAVVFSKQPTPLNKGTLPCSRPAAPRTISPYQCLSSLCSLSIVF